ncbi:MAG: iron ABC transporter permease [Chromatiales bacterium]|jgi:iron(III) transport system permease protein
MRSLTLALPGQQRRSINVERRWRWASIALALVVLMPLLVLALAWQSVDNAIWSHIATTILPEVLLNTAILVTGVAAGVLLLGVSLAWLTSMCDFPGRRFFDWALMLPFAMPAYVLAFVFLGLFDFSGPLQAGLRSLFDLPGNWFFEVRNAAGVVTVMTLVLYPYVYMLARVAFLSQGQAVFDAGRSLGLSPLQAFAKVALPMARPGIVAGLSLALMEALSDFGAVAVFNFDTFTTAIYKAWFGFFDLHAAAQLASMLLLLVLIALTLEKYLRGNARYDEHRATRWRRINLTGKRRLLASFYCGLVFSLAFVLPLVQLLLWAWQSRAELDSRYLDLFSHTLILGVSAAVLTVIGAFVLAYNRRLHTDRWSRLAVRIGTLGYALPGSVLAVGVMISLTWFDQQLADLIEMVTGNSSALLLSGSVIALLLAYFARFQAVAYGPIESALESIRPAIRDAARSLGASGWETVQRIYIPMLRPGLLTATLLVLVDTMKEMPATLLLRPFGWDTLAVRIYEMTSEGEWERAALPATALVLVGLAPVVILIRKSLRR